MNLRNLIILGSLIISFILSGISATPQSPDINTEVTLPSTSINITIPTIPTTMPTIPESVIEEALQNTYEYIPNLSKLDLKLYLENISQNIVELYQVIDVLDYQASNYLEISQKLFEEIWRLEELSLLYQEDYNALITKENKWSEKAEKYPVATEVWLFLKEEMDYSDYVCAGILGNMMTECGGQTLDLKWDARNKKSGCYGLCQWHPKYHPQMQYTSLEEQLEFIRETFPSILKKYMKIYEKGFTYEQFLELEDPKLIAYIFCVVYERPGSGTHMKRQENAMKAYEFFTS